MRRIFLLSLFLYTLLLAGLMTTNGALVALALPIAVYLTAGILRAPSSLSLEITRSLSHERTQPDVPVAITVTVINHGTELADVLFEDILSPQLTVQRGTARHLVHLPKGGRTQWSYTVGGPRGYYTFPGVKAAVQDETGLFQRKETIPTEGQLFILPPVMRLKHVAIRPRRTRVYAGIIPSNVGGSGVEFFGIREHQPGDSPRQINWRTSTRYPTRFFSNEYMQERVADVGIILDGRLQANVFSRGRSIFEYSVLAAGTLADAFLGQGDRVGLLLYGQFLRWTLPGYGKIQRERILHDLALAQPGSSQVFSYLQYLPTRLFPAHSQLVLVSPLLAEDAKTLVLLRARGYQLMVISPDPISLELIHLPQDENIDLAGRILRMERRILIQNIQRAGIRVLNWDITQPFDQVAHWYLSRPPIPVRTLENNS